MRYSAWLQEETDKATKSRRLNKHIPYPCLFSKSFMQDISSRFSHIKDLFERAKDLGYLSNNITKEDIDRYLYVEDDVTFIRWDEMLDAAISQYIDNNDKE